MESNLLVSVKIYGSPEPGPLLGVRFVLLDDNQVPIWEMSLLK